MRRRQQASSLPLPLSMDTARPVDGYAAPQLHTHAVVFNVTERDNGQTRALQERSLFSRNNMRLLFTDPSLRCGYRARL